MQVRCGSAAGAKGPTIFILHGESVRDTMSPKWLEDIGCPPGSCVLPGGAKGYMTNELWVDVAKIYAKWIRSLPVTCQT